MLKLAILRDQDALIRNMADYLQRRDAWRSDGDAIRSLMNRFKPVDVALYAREARLLAAKAQNGRPHA